MNTKGKNKKIVLDASQIAQVETLAACLGLERIGKYLGFCRTTFNKIRVRQSEVDDAYERGIAMAEMFASQTLLGFLKEKQNSPTKLEALKFYLTHKIAWTKAEFIPPKEEPQELKMSINILQAKQIGDK